MVLEWEFDAKQIRKRQNDEFTLSSMIAEQIALGLSNIKLRETLKNQSVRDPLTGLYNRRYMEECLERELQRCKRNTSSLAVIMLDIDHFKRFNDIYGHGAGDLVITEVARALSDNVRKGSDISSRYGGEEFLIVLPEISLKDAEERAETIRKLVAGLALKYNNVPLPTITISLGLAIYPAHAEKIDKLIEAADTALYQAKNKGRNQVVIYQPAS